MKLLLVRHGQAASELHDPEQRLSPTGKDEAKRLGALLKERMLVPAKIFHSGKARAKQTAEILAAALGVAEVAEKPGLKPNDPVTPIADELMSREPDIMLTGHLPHLGKLAALLLSGSENGPAPEFGSATCAVLKRTGKGDETKWSLVEVIRPR